MALLAFGESLNEFREVCLIWAMREYDVAESWTKIIVPFTRCVEQVHGCTSNDELLLETTDNFLISFDPKSQNKNNLLPNSIWKYQISTSTWMDYIANFMESLVFLYAKSV